MRHETTGAFVEKWRRTRAKRGGAALLPVGPLPPSYGEDMARVGGRNPVISWIVGMLCAGVVGALLWLAVPAGPAVLEVVGNGLRQLTP